jgi:hypothetical protein
MWGEAECEIERDQGNANCPAGTSPGFHDTRTATELSGGCCPEKLLPQPPPCDLSLGSVSVDTNTINLSGGGRANFRGNIFTSEGASAKWVIKVADRLLKGSGNYVSEFWDGKNSFGKHVEPGIYKAFFEAQATGSTCSPHYDSKELLIRHHNSRAMHERRCRVFR